MADRTVVVLDLRPGESFDVGPAVVEFEHKSGRVARLRISAPREVTVRRNKPSDEGKNSSAAAPGFVTSTAP